MLVDKHTSVFTPVPINLALIGPYMAGSLLGPRYGLLSQIIYIMTGALGIPVLPGSQAVSACWQALPEAL